MSRVSMFLSSLAVLVIAVSLSGCGGASDSSSDADPPQAAGADEHAGHDHGEGDHTAHMPAATEVNEAFAELSPEDRAAAEKQRICPVMDAPLGSMGEPFKITVEGRDVFLCCEGCKDKLTGDPDKYLAKLDK